MAQVSDDDDVLAGEYALGLLSWEDRLQVESRLRQDGGLRQRVEFWQRRLNSLLPDVTPVPAPPVLARVQKTLFGTAPAQPGLWQWPPHWPRHWPARWPLALAITATLLIGAALAAKVLLLLHLLP